jgi:hypothetical protein
MYLYKNGRSVDLREGRMSMRVRRMAANLAATALLVAAAGASAGGASSGPGTTTGNGVQGAGIDFHVTLGTDVRDGSCGTAAQLDVTQLDQVNFCYTVTNRSDVTLNYQTLSDDVLGTILSSVNRTLAPGASYQYNRIITARESQSPIATWTAYDLHPGYVFDDRAASSDLLFKDGFDGTVNTAPTYDFIDIRTVGTPLNLNDDDAFNVTMGFPFSFYGRTSDQIVVSNNGGILFGVTEGYLSQANTPLPNANLGAAILPYWTDIYYQQPENGNTYVATLGTAPNRRFVVEWFNLPIMIGGINQNGATFEVVFFEGSNQILFQYADTDVGDPLRNDGITTTIGINPPAGAEAAVQYSYQQASVGAGKAILFSPSNPTTFTASQQTVLDVGVPKIAVNPGRFNVSAVAGGVANGTLGIGNIGNRTLTWNVDSTTATSIGHFPPVSRFTLPMGDPSLTTAGPAPQARHGQSANEHRNPTPLDRGIAAFGIDLDSASLVSLDASHPDTLGTVGSIGSLILPAADFVDEDFTRLYAIDWYTYDLLAISTRSGETTRIGTAGLRSGAGINWNGLSWDASTRTLYGVAFGQSRDGLASYLYKIDPVTAATTLVGPITGIGDPAAGTLVVDIAVDSRGAMYGIDLVADNFVAIDKTSGAAAVISSLGFDANYAQGMDFDDYTGTLYYAAFNGSTGEAEMYTIDPAGGALTLVSSIGADSFSTQLAAFAVARLGGVCAYPDQVPWLNFDNTRGSTLAGGTSPVSVTFNASTLAAGTYTGTICVSSNDTTNRRVGVPVTLTVK